MLAIRRQETKAVATLRNYLPQERHREREQGVKIDQSEILFVPCKPALVEDVVKRATPFADFFPGFVFAEHGVTRESRPGVVWAKQCVRGLTFAIGTDGKVAGLGEENGINDLAFADAFVPVRQVGRQQETGTLPHQITLFQAASTRNLKPGILRLVIHRSILLVG